MRNDRERLLLYAGFCVAVLPVVLLRDFTPSNELRYLSIADEALRNGTFFAFTNHGVPYADKPPLYLWVIMLCRWLTGGHHMWLLSLFSLVPALATVHVMDSWTSEEMDYEGQSLARLMTLTCGLFLAVSVTLRMDMLMCLFIVLALREFWRMLTHAGRSGCSRWLFPVYIFLAVFTKGPLGLIIPLCCTVAFLAVSGRIRQVFRYWGWSTWIVLIALFGAWFCMVYAEGGAAYLDNLVFHQTVGRAVHSFRHNQPFYYYALSVWYCLAPWSLMVVGVFIGAMRPKFVRSDLQRFFLTVGTVTFVLLSCFSAKLQIYMLPAVPFVVYGAAMFLPRFGGSMWLRVSIAVPSVALALSLPVLAVVAAVGDMPYLNNLFIYGGALVLTLTGVRAFYGLYWKESRNAVLRSVRCIGMGMLVALFVAALALPRLNAEVGYGDLCRQALSMSREYHVDDFRTWRISRSENIDVYLHRQVVVIPKDRQPRFGGSRRFLLLSRKEDIKKIPVSDVREVGDYAVAICR